MSKQKYRQGKQINSIAEFSESESKFFIVYFGFKPSTKHREFLISWQYRLLERFVNNGKIFEAIEKGTE